MKSETPKVPTGAETAKRSKTPLIFAAFALAFAAFGVAFAVYLLRFPELWTGASTRETTAFRVQSRSMEPAFRGPRFIWRCPECGETFATSLDVDSPIDVGSFFDDRTSEFGKSRAKNFASESTKAVENAQETSSPENSNAASQEVRRFRETARFFPCPRCGFDRVPASSAVFQDGALVELASRFSASENVAAFGALPKKWSRAWRRVFQAKRDANAPNRWDVVIFRSPTGRATMKRVVGLPGETLAIRNGDVFVDGKILRRSFDAIFETSAPIDSVEFRRTDSRLSFVCVSPIWNDAAPTANGVPFSQTKFVPTPISNESPIPRWTGADVAPSELVRDFWARFSWSSADGRPVRFAVLARRPERAFLLEFDEKTRFVSLRSTELIDDQTILGKTFEQLSFADFADSSVERVPLKISIDATEAEANFAKIDAEIAPGISVFRVLLVDGELTLTRNGAEVARFSTDDADSTATAPISEPFAILGDVWRVGATSLRRDLHYSTIDGAAEPAVVPPGRYFLLGDNSPASFDGRFPDFGTVDGSDVLFRVVRRPPIFEFF